MKRRVVRIKSRSTAKYIIDFDGTYMIKRVLILTRGNKTIWSLIKTYINRLDVNEEFTRKDLFNIVYHKKCGKLLRRYESSLDQYRRSLTLVGCLEHVGYAKYKKLKNIPKGLSTSKLKKHAYSNSWKQWFIQLEDL